MWSTAKWSDLLDHSKFFFAVVSQDFKVHVALETYVIIGNDAILKCEVPSFEADLVSVANWVDEANEKVFLPGSRGNVMLQPLIETKNQPSITNFFFFSPCSHFPS